MKKAITLIVAIVVMVMFIALVGCGGGGGGGSTVENADGGKITFTVVGQDSLLIDLPAYVFKSDASFRTFKFDSDSSMFVIDDGDKFKIQFGSGGLADGTHIEISPSGITGN